MRRLLERMGAPFRLPEWSAVALIEAPDFVTRAHQAYVEACADILTTNSYGLAPHVIGEARLGRDGRALAERAWVAAGATIVGGCCGIGPEHIAAFRPRRPDNPSQRLAE